MPHTPISQRLRKNAKSMRRVMTEAELKLWNELRAHRLMGMAFRRQVPIAGYIVDFVCSNHRLIVEVDGSQHAEPSNAQYDGLRTARLRQDGWTILRFWNDDVLRDIDGVCSHIVIEAGLAVQKPDFWLHETAEVGPGRHYAFVAKSRAEVDAFHTGAIAVGGRDNGAPGLRPHYHEHYYGAFVFDPDGNNVEAVCHKPD